MKSLLFLSILFLAYTTQAGTKDLVESIIESNDLSREYEEFITSKVEMHQIQKDRIVDYKLPLKGTIDLTLYMKPLAVFSYEQTKLLEMFRPYCEGDTSPYGAFCMGSDVTMTYWMLAHRNHYHVLKEIVKKWADLIDSRNSVNALTDFSDIQKKYKMKNSEFFPLIAFIGLDDNSVQYDRFLESLLKMNEKENYVRYFGLLFDIASLDSSLPDMAIGKISYSLRTGTSVILPNKVDHRKTYKDFSLFGIACLAFKENFSKDSVILNTKIMTAGYEMLKLKTWSSKDFENPSAKIQKHLDDAQKRINVSEDVIKKAEVCL